MQRLAAGLALAAALTACGEPQKAEPQTTVATSAGGESVTVTTQGGEVNLTEGATITSGGRPAFAADYPGAEVRNDIAARERDSVGGVYGFTTTDPADKVFAFYRTRADAAGLAPQTNVDTAGARIYGAKGPKGDVSLVITPQDGGQTYVQVTWSTPNS